MRTTLHPSGAPGEQGAAAIEFALVLPVLVVLLFGIIEFSLMYNRQQALHSAAREGARVAALETSTKTDIVSAVDGALSGTSFSSTRTIGVTPDVTQPCLNRAGQAVTITVHADSAVDVPLWNNLTVALTGKAEFRCE